MRTLAHDESVVLDFLTADAEIGRYPVRARAQAKDSRLIGAHSAQQTILGLLDAIDQRLRQLKPDLAGFLGPSRLVSVGLRRANKP